MTIKADLERCLRSPYLSKDESKPSLAGKLLEDARDLLDEARVSFEEDDETTGLKQAWGAMYRAGRALVFAAGYDVDRLDCLEIVLHAHYADSGLTEDDLAEFQKAQELVGTPEEAIGRAEAFLEKSERVLQTVAV